MKNIYLLAMLALSSMISHAQLAAGTEGMVILDGTSININGLVLTPSGGNFSFASNAIQVSSTPVTGTPTPGINRVYIFDSPISFDGMLDLYYQPAELNGNNESLLSLHSTDNTTWTSAPGTVNTTSHFVSHQTVLPLTFNRLTAAESTTVLPLTINGFKATVQSHNVLLGWKVSNNNNYKGFQLESSGMNGSWLPVANIAAVASISGDRDYLFTDYDMNFEKRLYRLRLDLKNGGSTYSNTVMVTKTSLNTQPVITTSANTLIIHFLQQQPDQLLLFGANGQLLYKTQVSRNYYQVTAPKGVYLLQYFANGIKYTRKGIVR